MLPLDDLLNAAAIESMTASGNYGLFQNVKANSACLLALDPNLQHILKRFDILGRQWDDLMLIKETSQLVDTVFA